jgi:hypothetical protein
MNRRTENQLNIAKLYPIIKELCEREAKFQISCMEAAQLLRKHQAVIDAKGPDYYCDLPQGAVDLTRFGFDLDQLIQYYSKAGNFTMPLLPDATEAALSQFLITANPNFITRTNAVAAMGSIVKFYPWIGHIVEMWYQENYTKDIDDEAAKDCRKLQIALAAPVRHLASLILLVCEFEKYTPEGSEERIAVSSWKRKIHRQLMSFKDFERLEIKRAEGLAQFTATVFNFFNAFKQPLSTYSDLVLSEKAHKEVQAIVAGNMNRSVIVSDSQRSALAASFLPTTIPDSPVLSINQESALYRSALEMEREGNSLESSVHQHEEIALKQKSDFAKEQSEINRKLELVAQQQKAKQESAERAKYEAEECKRKEQLKAEEARNERLALELAHKWQCEERKLQEELEQERQANEQRQKREIAERKRKDDERLLKAKEDLDRQQKELALQQKRIEERKRRAETEQRLQKELQEQQERTRQEAERLKRETEERTRKAREELRLQKELQERLNKENDERKRKEEEQQERERQETECLKREADEHKRQEEQRLLKEKQERERKEVERVKREADEHKRQEEQRLLKEKQERERKEVERVKLDNAQRLQNELQERLIREADEGKRKEGESRKEALEKISNTHPYITLLQKLNIDGTRITRCVHLIHNSGDKILATTEHAISTLYISNDLPVIPENSCFLQQQDLQNKESNTDVFAYYVQYILSKMQLMQNNGIKNAVNAYIDDLKKAGLSKENIDEFKTVVSALKVINDTLFPLSRDVLTSMPHEQPDGAKFQQAISTLQELTATKSGPHIARILEALACFVTSAGLGAGIGIGLSYFLILAPPIMISAIAIGAVLGGLTGLVTDLTARALTTPKTPPPSPRIGFFEPIVTATESVMQKLQVAPVNS